MAEVGELVHALGQPRRWPVVALFGSLAEEPGRAAELDAEFHDFAVRANRGAPGGPVEYHYEYLLVVARRRSG